MLRSAPYQDGWIVLHRNSATTKIVNVVASATLKQEVDLKAVARAFPRVEYRQKQFPGLVFRLKKLRTTTLIFGSGKMVCTGAKSEREATRALKSIVRKLRKAGVIILSRPEIEIHNIVASASLGGGVDLVRLYMSEGGKGGIMYEPEQFPGVIYRMENPHVVVIIFASGKLICAGAKKEKDVLRAVNKLHQKLEDEKVMYYEESAMPLMQLHSKPR